MKRLTILLKRRLVSMLNSIDSKSLYIALVSLLIGVVLASLFLMHSRMNILNNDSSPAFILKRINSLSGRELEKEYMEQMMKLNQLEIDISKTIIDKKVDNIRVFNIANKNVKSEQRDIDDLNNWIKEYNN